MDEKRYPVMLTGSQISTLAEFVEFNFIRSIRDDVDIDNINYLCDMCDAYKILLSTLEKLRKGGDSDETD